MVLNGQGDTVIESHCAQCEGSGGFQVSNEEEWTEGDDKACRK